MLESLLLILSSGAVAATDPVSIAEPNPKAMSSADIKAYNARISRTHPYYIRCVKTAETGSLVKRNLSCRTNSQWKQADVTGNQNARDTVEAMQKSSTSGR